ncbi:MAG: NlpC/P60 family protein [Chthoniobacteraceae bacterium]|nr:NlpC/P60 family protein [Chthoniobacteraceae bacterium]
MAKRLFSRRNAWLLWGTGFCWFLAVCLYPVSTGLTRAAGAALAGALALGLLGLWWRRPVARWSLLALFTAAALLGALPGRTSYDRPALRREIARAGARYEGVRYVWGGENRLGIDCSGLVRRAAIEGTFTHGVRTLNPWLIRRAFALWWSDMSASEMGRGAAGTARKAAAPSSLRLWNDKNLHPGDFAITASGVHALLYLGDHLWLEADPSALKVQRLRTGRDRSAWLETPVAVLRWRYLELAAP